MVKRKLVLCVALLCSLLVGCSQNDNSKPSKEELKIAQEKKAQKEKDAKETTAYVNSLNVVLKHVGNNIDDIYYLSQAVKTNPLIITDSSFRTSLENLTPSIRQTTKEIRALDVGQVYALSKIQTHINNIAFYLDTIATNYPRAVENKDIGTLKLMSENLSKIATETDQMKQEAKALGIKLNA